MYDQFAFVRQRITQHKRSFGFAKTSFTPIPLCVMPPDKIGEEKS
jgi:hypothetical protein